MTNYADCDATMLAELVRSKQASASELMAEAIGRAEQLDPKLGMLSGPLFEQGRDAAAAFDASPGDRPFGGVPFLVKDIGAPAAGEPHQMGCKVLSDAGYVADEDSYLAIRFRDAGLLTFGRTTCPEFAVSMLTESAAHGPTRNPWDTTRTPGGSSGGSAAAVAARVVPAAHGNDGAGSIRMPASLTGTVGLKSTRARVSNGPGLGEAWAGLAHEGVITRTVRDAARMLDLIAGTEPGDPYSAAPPARPFAASVNETPAPLRVGLMTVIAGFDTDPECVRAATATAECLAQLGHHVEDSHPLAMDAWSDKLPAFHRVVSTHVLLDREFVEQAVGRPVADDEFEPFTRQYFDVARRVSATDYLASVEVLRSWAREIATWWANGGFDLLVTPTMATPAPLLDEPKFHADDPEGTTRRHYSYFPYTPAFNVTGQPAISLPLHQTPTGLPVGVQLVAATLREDLLFAVSAQLERAMPWADRRPSILS